MCEQLIPNEKIKEAFFAFTRRKSLPLGACGVAVTLTTSCHRVLSESFYDSVPPISWLCVLVLPCIPESSCGHLLKL